MVVPGHIKNPKERDHLLSSQEPNLIKKVATLPNCQSFELGLKKAVPKINLPAAYRKFLLTVFILRKILE
jgi:hypothetical protein